MWLEINSYEKLLANLPVLTVKNFHLVLMVEKFQSITTQVSRKVSLILVFVVSSVVVHLWF